MVETAPPQFAESRVEHEGTRLFRSILPTERRSSILDIDFKDWTQKGVNTLLLDAEGTFLPIDTWDVDPNIVEKIREARESGIDNIAIVTNKEPKDKMSFLKLTYWAYQIGADINFVPLKKSERKPSPIMYLKALQKFGITAEQALVVGDKIRADIIAANRAGIRSILIEDKVKDPVDDREYIGEVLLGEPLEHALQSIVRYVEKTEGLPAAPKNTVLSALSGVPFTFEEDTPQEAPLRRWNPSDLLTQIDPTYQKISGYGAEEVVLPLSVRELVPFSYGVVTKQLQQQLLKAQHSDTYKWVDNAMKDHGREIADVATLARMALTPLTIYLLHKKRFGWAFTTELIALASDAEGIPARHDKRGLEVPSKVLGNKGPVLDPLADKEESVGVSGELTLQELESPVDFAIQTGRDLIMTKARKKRVTEGKFASAVWPGKVSTNLANLWRLYAIAEGRKHPSSVRTTAHLVTLAKVASAAYTYKIWQKLEVWKQADFQRVEEVMSKLATIDEAA